MRSSSILVSSTTVKAVHLRGATRTWGMWRQRTGAGQAKPLLGCAIHPWARLTVQQPGRQARTTLVSSVHVAPRGRRLKTREVRRIGADLERVSAATSPATVVIGGDLNLSRCRDGHVGETTGCAVRAAHRALLDAGYTDAIRSRHLRGSTGVVGMQHRIDFLYVEGVLTGAAHDRCYRSGRVDR